MCVETVLDIYKLAEQLMNLPECLGYISALLDLNAPIDPVAMVTGLYIT